MLSNWIFVIFFECVFFLRNGKVFSCFILDILVVPTSGLSSHMCWVEIEKEGESGFYLEPGAFISVPQGTLSTSALFLVHPLMAYPLRWWRSNTGTLPFDNIALKIHSIGKVEKQVSAGLWSWLWSEGSVLAGEKPCVSLEPEDSAILPDPCIFPVLHASGDHLLLSFSMLQDGHNLLQDVETVPALSSCPFNDSWLLPHRGPLLSLGKSLHDTGLFSNLAVIHNVSQ